ncbi:MAG: family 78 glycoside hydrolase catalytic domain [Bacteroidota bacterium]
MKAIYLWIGLLLACNTLFAEIVPHWISYPSANNTTYGVYHFRKQFSLDTVPDSLWIAISADNRYRLFVNGRSVCFGPAKGDLQTYKYDQVDIQAFLEEGQNVIAVLVFNLGQDKPMSFFSNQTAFFLTPISPQFDYLSTNQVWKVYQNPAYEPITYQEMLFDKRWFYGYYACGPGDRLDVAQYPHGWAMPSFDDQEWPKAEALHFEGSAPWPLMARNIPFMRVGEPIWPQIRQIEGFETLANWPQDQHKLVIPPHTKAKVLLDFEHLSMGYPELDLKGGENSQIRIRYAEALYEKFNLKAHRDSIKGLEMFGVWDELITDGTDFRFIPLWKRCFRYVQLEIQTNDEALHIERYVNRYSGYPYEDLAEFHCDNDTLNQIFEMCRRTLEMCSGETYYDTPFYEQMSYGGDNRPIAALSTYLTTDDRLLREMLRIYPQSANPATGLMTSAYPSRFPFDHGSWSLVWVQTIYDYFQYRADSSFVKTFIEPIEGVLNYYARHMDESTNLLGYLPERNFIDWSIDQGRVPRTSESGECVHSTMMSLCYLQSLQTSIKLYQALGENHKAQRWELIAAKLKAGIKIHCWNEERQLYQDAPDRTLFSQHSNVLAILCGLDSPDAQRLLMQKILEEEFDEYASSYFSYYLFCAMQQTGREGAILDQMGFWYDFIERGHSTVGETGFASHDRSDCHAWSAHPAHFFLASVVGMRPAGLASKEITFVPHLGKLNRVEASLPHPAGRIKVHYQRQGELVKTNITLPTGLVGKLIWEDKTFFLQSGPNHLQITK